MPEFFHFLIKIFSTKISHKLVDEYGYTVRQKLQITIYAPMIYTAPCVMFLMRADTLCGEVGGELALEI